MSLFESISYYLLRVFVVTMVMMISGCVQINVPQLNSLYQLIVPPIDPLDAHKWELQIGEYKSQVYLLNISGQSVFANENQDILVLRNQTLTSIALPDVFNGTIEATDRVNFQNNIIRTINVNDTLFEVQECNTWIKEKFNKQEKGTHTKAKLECKGTKLQTNQLIYSDDELQHLTQFIPYIDKSISLSKVLIR